MKSLKPLFLMLLIWAIAFPAQAQTGTLSGNVTDAATHRPLPGANVILVGTQLGTTTDASGSFRITGLLPGKYTVAVRFIGYKSVQKTVLIGKKPVTLAFELQPQTLSTQEIVITANRAKFRETPVAFTNISRKELKTNYWAQDIPMLLTEVPGVYAYSDAGNGVGYTYVKIRGFDQKRISVMINGIPLNDPEDHQVYWVDMPDLASSVRDIQIQRGVGSSLYGSSSFGGSINVVTGEPASESKIRLTTGYGSYNTRKFAFHLNSGLIQNKYVIQGRFSKILSDGYRENTGVNLWAYFLSASRYGTHTTTQINVYGGPELTHAGWYASPESALKQNHRYNPITYKNTIDNFNQPHYELIHQWKISNTLTLNNSLFYIHGIGYYEGFKSHKKLVDFGFLPFFTPDSQRVKRADLVRQKWVKKNQIGWIPRLDWAHTKGTLSLGMSAYTYWSDHWGNVIWINPAPPSAVPNQEYYGYNTRKNLATFFVHELAHPVPPLSVMLDFNLQFQQYTFKQREVALFRGINRHAFEVHYTFLNPKLGVNYNLSKTLNLFGNISVAHREPSDDDLFDVWQGPDDLGVHPLFARSDTIRRSDGSVDYIDWRNPLTKPEDLLDFELGGGYTSRNLQVKLNAYWMNFRNEIVPYSQV
ncbi:MAG: TonB-dependent receptor, partial [Calditrichaeota bacterium]|nr:TonB-dependent receptor [Calditrichota bacterium]